MKLKMLYLISDKDWTCQGMFQNLNKFIILYRTNKCTLVIKTFIFAFPQISIFLV